MPVREDQEQMNPGAVGLKHRYLKQENTSRNDSSGRVPIGISSQVEE